MSDAAVSWAQFSEVEPKMAASHRDLLGWIPISYLATVRKAGAPRLHPVCPIFAGDGMFVAVLDTSPKRFDLANDGRYALHDLPGKQDEEFYVTGRATRVGDAAVLKQVQAAAGHTVNDHDWVFELRIGYGMMAHWEKRGQPDTYPVRREWHAPPTDAAG